MVYAHALVILHGYEKIKWPDAPEWARRDSWVVAEMADGPAAVEAVTKPVPAVSQPKAKSSSRDSVWAPSTSGGWV